MVAPDNQIFLNLCQTIFSEKIGRVKILRQYPFHSKPTHLPWSGRVLILRSLHILAMHSAKILKYLNSAPIGNLTLQLTSPFKSVLPLLSPPWAGLSCCRAPPSRTPHHPPSAAASPPPTDRYQATRIQILVGFLL